MTMTHAEHSRKAKSSVPCSAEYITFGGHCLNCGYDPRTKSLERQSYGQYGPGYIRAHCLTCGWVSHWHHQDDDKDMTTLQGVEATHRCSDYEVRS